MDRLELSRRIEAELSAAQRARAEGNEGRARVCARRAAGLAAAAFIRAGPGHESPGSSLQSLRAVLRRDGIPTTVRGCAARLTARVTENHHLPHPEDPLDDARALVEWVLDNARPTG